MSEKNPVFENADYLYCDLLQNLPENGNEFFDLIERFRYPDGSYHLGTNEQLFGGGMDARYDFIVHATYEIAINSLKYELDDHHELKRIRTVEWVLSRMFGSHGYDMHYSSIDFLKSAINGGIINYIENHPLMENAFNLMIVGWKKYLKNCDDELKPLIVEMLELCEKNGFIPRDDDE